MFKLVKLMFPLLLAGAVSGADANQERQGPTMFRDLFCPECIQFVGDEWSIDGEGNHKQCGRKPVAVEAGLLGWAWCAEAHAWLSKPCGRNASRGCCTPYSRTALVRLDVRGTLSRAPYCPLCRFVLANATTYDSKPTCATCGRPMVETDVVTRAWYWCRGDEAWYEQPCSMDRTGKCCTVRTVTVPAVVLNLRPYFELDPLARR